MPLSWNEIKDRALKFSRDWADTDEAERQGAQTFWNDFFNVFGVNRRRLATFEWPVKKLDGRDGRIDCLWKGMLLIEHKSRGKDLNRAYDQARDYIHGLADAELPKYLLVSDFARFRLYDLDGDKPPVEFDLRDLHKQVRRFGFIAGYQPRAFEEEDPVNVLAAERMGKLHDALKAAGYDGHVLEVLLVRLLFCLFADDTGIFARLAFHELITQRTSPDGADLGQWLGQLFQTLNTDTDKRQKTLDAQLAEFPYVNGKLFAEPLPLAAFDARMRGLLLDASILDWSRISPAIFGSMFQSVMDATARRNLGAHYTSEKNILKLIGPLFLDDLKTELDRIGTHEAKLKVFHNKLARLKFLDPACGCGNFLVIAYRELRLVELEVLTRLYSRQGSVLTNVADHVALDVDQFFGIEIEEFPAQIAQVALWLVDHQMNLRVAEQFGEYFARLPLKKSPTIAHCNALLIDWASIVPASELNFILGNPPFIGSKMMSEDQREQLVGIAGNLKSAGVLDFVSAWYLRAAKYMAKTSIRAALVSTNSICQGEQVGLLWGALLSDGIHIHFAHQTFRWNNEAKGVAAVHCIIVGFGFTDVKPKRLFTYEHANADPHEVVVSNINPYLIDAADIVLPSRTKPISSRAPEITIGNKPIDGGYYLFSDEEKAAFIAEEPSSAPLFRKWLGADEFINGWHRWCLWVGDTPPDVMTKMPKVVEVVQAVKEFRLGKRAAKRAKADKEPKVGTSALALASTPTRFHVERFSKGPQLVIPSVSSEKRTFIPIGFEPAETLCSNLVLLALNANLYDFGVLNSTMHMAWVRYTCGRLKSDFRYSKDIVYNNYPWPDTLTEKQRETIQQAAQDVLDARAAFPSSTLADLYNPSTMPPLLVKAHQSLDRAVDAAYGKRAFQSDADRVAFLFERYQAMTSLLPAAAVKKPTRRKESA